jgi:hypothetical protein
MRGNMYAPIDVLAVAIAANDTAPWWFAPALATAGGIGAGAIAATRWVVGKVDATVNRGMKLLEDAQQERVDNATQLAAAMRSIEALTHATHEVATTMRAIQESEAVEGVKIDAIHQAVTR